MVYTHTHTLSVSMCVHTDAALEKAFYLWGKRGFVEVWKIKSRYFWQLEPAERLDHYLEAAAESAVEMWVRGAGGREVKDLLQPC